ncbi:DNA primase [Tissierella carlieri]|uniref:DNA primase n=2 Tax=Tissierella carlieri TaxID=689904 RepID=UPI00386DC0FE
MRYSGDNMTGYINDETIEKVRDAANIVDIISDYIPLKKSGGNYVGLCPFHNEKTPSFTVSDTKQFFHCFGCGEGGDALAFIMKKENLTFPEAVKFLADKLGITVEEETPRNEKLYQDRDRGYDINREAARFFFSNLTKEKIPLSYLYQRKINNKVIKQFGLGYSLNKWNSLHKYLQDKGYKNEEIEKLGLIGKKTNSDEYYDKFRNRIMFPIIDTKGRVIGFGGRVLDNSMPKYLNSQETFIFNKGNHLYGLNLVNKLSDRKRIILVEGYMDVISLFSKGINYAVASLGTALTERQAKLLKRYGENVYICYDSDQAGINATNKAIQILLKEGIEPKVVTLGKFKDPDDFLKENTIEKFENRLNEALNYIDFRIHVNKQKYNINEAEGKIKFTIEIAKIIKELKSPIEKDVYINKIAAEMNISKEAIQKEVFGNNIKGVENKNFKEKLTISPVRTILPSASLIAEIDLIKLMIFDKEYFDILIREVSLDEYENLECREILKIMIELYQKAEDLDEDLLYKRVKELPGIDTGLLSLIFERPINFLPENIDQMIKDLITTLKINKLETKRNNIKKEIEELERKSVRNSNEDERFLKLCIELTNLNKELNLMRYEEGR